MADRNLHKKHYNLKVFRQKTSDFLKQIIFLKSFNVVLIMFVDDACLGIINRLLMIFDNPTKSDLLLTSVLKNVQKYIFICTSQN